MNLLKTKESNLTIWSDLLFLLSTVAVLCLLTPPTITGIVISALSMILAVIYLLFGLKGRITETIKPKGLTIVLVLMTELVALLKFIVTWFPSSIVRSVASTVGLPLPIFLLIIGLVGCLAGFYALYIIYQNCIRYIR